MQWRNISLFAGLDNAQLEKVASIFHAEQYDEGKFLMREGEPGDAMYILVRGRVRVSKSMLLSGVVLPLLEMKTPHKTLATLEGQSFPILGEMALLDRDVRSANVETLEPCEFFVTTRERFFTLLQQDPALGCTLLQLLGRRLAATVRKNNTELVKMTTALALALSRR